jgi:hypothetical protein
MTATDVAMQACLPAAQQGQRQCEVMNRRLSELFASQNECWQPRYGL